MFYYFHVCAVLSLNSLHVFFYFHVCFIIFIHVCRLVFELVLLPPYMLYYFHMCVPSGLAMDVCSQLCYA